MRRIKKHLQKRMLEFVDSAFACLFIGLILSVPSAAPAANAPTNEPVKKSKVVQAVDPNAVQQLIPDPSRTKNLFQKAFLEFTGSANEAEGWKKLVNPQDRIGIKIHSSSGPNLVSHREIITEIIKGLKSAGVEGSHILIFDQYATSLEESGYKPGLFDDSVKIIANVPGKGYDPEVKIDAPLPGKLIWGDLEFNDAIPEKEDQLSSKSHFSKILTKDIDKLINVAIPTTHPLLEFWGCELNVTLAMCDNYRRFQRPNSSRDDSLAEIFGHQALQKKLILNVLDALVVQYAGGIECDPNFCWPLGSIYISKDAIALDSLVVREIDKIRPRAKLQPLGEISYLKSTADANLGTMDPEKIDIRVIQSGR